MSGGLKNALYQRTTREQTRSFNAFSGFENRARKGNKRQAHKKRRKINNNGLKGAKI
jgi:hypothetical protein